MKTNIIIALIFFVFILSCLAMSCGNVMPYSVNSPYARFFPYEGFTDLEYTNNLVHQPMDASTANNINAAPTECAKVYGFDGLFCKPYSTDNKLDVFSGTEGKPSCVGGSSGLSNSQGGLCLSAVQKTLLSTRGGNSTGKDSVIGK